MLKRKRDISYKTILVFNIHIFKQLYRHIPLKKEPELRNGVLFLNFRNQSDIIR
jgi:hypothetical protein